MVETRWAGLGHMLPAMYSYVASQRQGCVVVQVVILHHMMSKAVVKARPSVLWCYKKELGFSRYDTVQRL